MKRQSRFYLVLLFVLLCSTPAWANPITPAIAAMGMHLLFLNAIIGVLEGLLIALAFCRKILPSIITMILANYFSMWVGCIVLGAGKIVDQYLTLYNLHLMAGLAVLIMFAAAVLLEWPFCFFIFRHTPQRFRRSFEACCAAQFFSYTLLAFLYFPVYQLVPNAEVTLDPSLAFVKDQATIYYLDPDKKNIYSIRPDGREPTLFLKLPPSSLPPNQSEYDQICLVPGSAGKFDLVYTYLENLPEDRVILQKDWLSSDRYCPITEEIEHRWMFRCPAIDLRPDSTQKVQVLARYNSGLHCTNAADKTTYQFIVDAPFITLYTQYPTILPGNQVIYQLGDWIVAFDLNTKKLGAITKGTSPLVIPDQPLNAP